MFMHKTVFASTAWPWLSHANVCDVTETQSGRAPLQRNAALCWWRNKFKTGVKRQRARFGRVRAPYGAGIVLPTWTQAEANCASCYVFSGPKNGSQPFQSYIQHGPTAVRHHESPPVCAVHCAPGVNASGPSCPSGQVSRPSPVFHNDAPRTTANYLGPNGSSGVPAKPKVR